MLVEEEDSLAQELVAASRLICANLAEAWEQRHSAEVFVEKLNAAKMKAAAVQTWLAFAVEYGYLEPEAGQQHGRCYGAIVRAISEQVEGAAGWEGNRVA